MQFGYHLYWRQKSSSPGFGTICGKSMVAKMMNNFSPTPLTCGAHLWGSQDLVHPCFACLVRD